MSETAVNAHPANPPQHRDVGEREAALAALAEKAAADPANAAIKVDLACALREAGDRVSARSMLAEVLAMDPGRIRALIELGHLSRSEGDETAALAAFEQALAREPTHAGLMVEIARSRRLLGDGDGAAAALARALATRPGHVGTLIEDGHLKRSRGDHAGALAAFVAAGQVDPHHAGIRLETAESLVRLGRPHDAEATLRGLIEAQPDQLPALLRLGHLAAESDRTDEAGRWLNRAATAHPNDARAPLALARLARRRGDGAAAARHLAVAAALDPAGRDLRIDLAAELREQGDAAGARRVLRAVLDGEPTLARGWMQLGFAERAGNDRAAALAAFEAAANLTAGDGQALVEAAREKHALGDEAGADETLRQALERAPANAEALCCAAEFALRSERADEAFDLARRAIEHHPRLVGPYLLAARAAASIPDRGAAMAMIEAADAAFPAQPAVLATRIHVLRRLCDHALTGEAVARAVGATHDFAVWLESTTFAIASGDFPAAERALAGRAGGSPREAARVALLHGQLAEARRDYEGALRQYRQAIALDPSDRHWNGEAARAALLALDLDAARGLLAAQLAAPGRAEARQRPLNFLVGQMLDDFALDDETVTRLAETATEAPQDQVDRLVALAAGVPDSTAASVMLLLAMRRAGRLAWRSGGEAGPGAIPRRIFQYWDTGAPPPDIADLMASWRSEDGGADYILFDDGSAAAFLKERHAPEVATAFQRAEHVAQRADLFRLAYLAVEGGLYADADDRRAAPFDALVPAGATFAGYQENFGTLGNNFLAAAPGHPVILKALDLAVAAVNRGDRDSVWLSTGPGLLTRAFAAVAAAGGGRVPAASVRELWEMAGLVEIHCPARYKVTPAHWSRAA